MKQLLTLPRFDPKGIEFVWFHRRASAACISIKRTSPLWALRSYRPPSRSNGI